MKNIFSYLAFAILLLAGCKKDDIAPPIDRTTLPRTIGQFIQNNYDLSLFNAALVKTGLIDSLNQPNFGTVFAPDNAAFNYMGIASAAEINRMNTDSLRNVLKGYMITQRMFVTDFPVQSGTAITTRSGKIMYMGVSGGVPFNGTGNREVCVNGALVLKDNKRNIGLANGVVHTIKKLMNYHDGTVQDYLAADTSLSIFVAVMKRFNYWDGLKNNNPVTVFAPNNAAFAKKGITADSVTRMNPVSFREELFGIYHFNLTPKRIFTTDGFIISGSVYADGGLKIGKYSFQPNYGYNSWNQAEESYISMSMWQDALWYPNADGVSQVKYDGGDTHNADHLTSNGLVHVIDGLVLYPEKLLR